MAAEDTELRTCRSQMLHIPLAHPLAAQHCQAGCCLPSLIPNTDPHAPCAWHCADNHAVRYVPLRVRSSACCRRYRAAVRTRRTAARWQCAIRQPDTDCPHATPGRAGCIHPPDAWFCAPCPKAGIAWDRPPRPRIPTSPARLRRRADPRCGRGPAAPDPPCGGESPAAPVRPIFFVFRVRHAAKKNG